MFIKLERDQTVRYPSLAVGLLSHFHAVKFRAEHSPHSETQSAEFSGPTWWRKKEKAAYDERFGADQTFYICSSGIQALLFH